jgi:hypothetical protein
MIDHERFRLLAAQRVDGTLTDDEAHELDAHLATCPDCRAVAAGIERDHRALLAGLRGAPLAPRVTERVMAEIRPRRRSTRWSFALAAAAISVVLVGVVLVTGSRPTPTPSPSPTSPATPEITWAPTPAPSPTARAIVNGAYAYSVRPGAQRRDSVTALETDPAAGEWSRMSLPTGVSLGGPLTCVVVDGHDAWMAGPATTVSDGQTGLAAFLYVHDSGLAGGAGDTAITWITDTGQTLETMEGWCRGRYIPAGPYPLEEGDIVVDASP